MERKSVELLAPAGTWNALLAAIDAGADAVYLGGKAFNMRVHDSSFNFDDEQLKEAIIFAHNRGVKIYVTLNNLISNEELLPLENYLRYLDEIKPDAILVQDLAVINFAKKFGVKIPIHASIMMNIHNSPAVELLKEFGVTRVVISREFSLAEVSLIKNRTKMEIEYFVHGDMCFSESEQCIHSGIVFGQSGNRGRCMKPCRWTYKFIDENSGETLNDWSHKLALNDMCMFRNIPELIQAGVTSFKIEGRMRPPEFIHRLVSTYRAEIDAYFADPMGYSVDENRWKTLFSNRVRNFTTTFAFGAPTTSDIGLTGKREPKIFSKAVVEPKFDDLAVQEIFSEERAIKSAEKTQKPQKPQLTVRVMTLEAARAAIESGADLIYVGGEVFRPLKPWKRAELQAAIEFTHAAGKKIVLATPRTSRDKDLAELEICAGFDGVLVGNLGALNFVKAKTDAKIFADVSFSIFNPVAAEFLQKLGAIQATASLELGFAQLRSVVEGSSLPIEVIVHGAIESMLSDNDIAKLYVPNYDKFATPEKLERHYALVDEAGEIHKLRVDQFNRWHIFFGKELCLLPYIEKFLGAAALRIEAQNYSPEETAQMVKLYRKALDGEKISVPDKNFGAGVYRFKQSKNSFTK